MNQNPLIEKLRLELPFCFTRNQVNDLTGGVINSKTLANLDSLKKGPARFRVGRLVTYERETFLDWLEARMQV
jgi:hypothetical protein